MNICIMTGARPNFVKVAPLVKAVEKARVEGTDVTYSLVYAGAEGDPTLEGTLFEDLGMPRPHVYLGVTSQNMNDISSAVMKAFEDYLNQHKVDVVIVVDDLASTMAAAIVTKKHGLRLAHLVAGTRSFDINMPKEINRLIIDGLSDILFTAGTSLGTKADPSKIYVVGNILMDTLRANMPRFRRPNLLNDNNLRDGEYGVLTINRRALLANEDNLELMLKAMAREVGQTKIVAPLRGEAREKVERLTRGLDCFLFVEPQPYLEFGYLSAHAKFIITDSGNVAEEATFNGVPCITLNNYTEHIETVKEGTNTLVNEDAELLGKALADIMQGKTTTHSIPDHWDGRTADRIVKCLVD